MNKIIQNSINKRMYNNITIQYMQKSKQFNLPSSLNAESIKLILTKRFNLQSEIIGVTDQNGKFYPLEYFLLKLQAFNNKIIKLVTECNDFKKGFIEGHFIGEEEFINMNMNMNNIRAISFATNSPHEFQLDDCPFNDYCDEQANQFNSKQNSNPHKQNQIIAEIYNLKDSITLVLETQNIKNIKNSFNFMFKYYYLKGKSQKIHIYQHKRKFCQVFLHSKKHNQTEDILKRILRCIDPNIQNDIKGVPKVQMNVQKKQQKYKKRQKKNDDLIARQQSSLLQTAEIEQFQQNKFQIPIIVRRKDNNKIQKITIKK